MKKNLILWICLFTTVLLTGCSKQSSPRQVVTTFWTYVQEEKYEEAIHLYADIDELFSDEEKEFVKTILTAEIKLWGTINDYEIISVEEWDKNRATVKVKVDAANVPHPLDKTFNVRKIDGKWYIDYL